MTDSSLTAPLTGGCLCGAVRFEARPERREGYYCHCRMCQLAFGNTRATFVNLPNERVTWSGTPPTEYASSKFARRGFCKRCGTPLSFAYVGSKNLDLAVGAFDDPSAFSPASHFAVESRVANWHTEDGLPGQRLDEYTALTDRWKAAYGDDVVPGIAATRKA